MDILSSTTRSSVCAKERKQHYKQFIANTHDDTRKDIERKISGIGKNQTPSFQYNICLRLC